MNETCPRVRSLLHDYLEGELSEETSRRVAEHLRTCTECDHHAKRWSEDLYELLEASSEPVPSAFALQVRRSLRWKRRRGVVSTEMLGRLLPILTVLLIPVLAYQAYRMLERFETSDLHEVIVHSEGPVFLQLDTDTFHEYASLAGPLTLWAGSHPLDLRIDETLSLTTLEGTVLERRRTLSTPWSDERGYELVVLFDVLWGQAKIRNLGDRTQHVSLPFDHILSLDASSCLEVRTTTDGAPRTGDSTIHAEVPLLYEIALRQGTCRILDAWSNAYELEPDEPYWLTPNGVSNARGRVRGCITARRTDESRWGPWSDLRIQAIGTDRPLVSRTDAEGNFTLYVPMDDMEIVGLEIFSQQDQRVGTIPRGDWKGGRADADLRNAPMLEVSLRGPAGVPLSGARVECSNPLGRTLRTTTDEEGVLRLPEIMTMPWQLVVQHEALPARSVVDLDTVPAGAIDLPRASAH